MKNYIIFLVLALNVIINNVNAQSAENENNNNMSMKMDHSHLPIAIPSNGAKPALSLSLNKDTMSGYNLHLQIQHYTLIPPPS